MRPSLLIIIAAMTLVSMGCHTSRTTWYKGNTHTHTTRSDGDSDPSVVAQWYEDHGYDFLFLTDHNTLTDPSEVTTRDGKILLFPGIEVSSVFRNALVERAAPIHVNALGADVEIPEVRGSESVLKTLQDTIDNINNAGAMPHVNHPNFRWAISNLDLLQTTDFQLLEIVNGHPLVNNEGNEDHMGMEDVWDILLSDGKLVYGIGCDDAHHFKGEFAPDRSNPGRAWIQIRAEELTEESVIRALEAGDFYFSTGAELKDVRVTERSYVVIPKDKKAIIEFIGFGGEVLHTSKRGKASYELDDHGWIRGNNYVRARITDSDGNQAWTQPHR